MNALRDNPFTQSLRRLGQALQRPKAILCISAHWMTRGTWVTSMQNPITIHDFSGFPNELFDVQYPAPGDPEIADRVCASSSRPSIHADGKSWGLDHGTWSVLRHMYPAADVPVLQLSLDLDHSAEFHFALGEKLRHLRNEGVLIVGSGNIVHNLGKIRFADDAKPYDWALQFDEWVKQRLEERDYSAIVHQAARTTEGKLSIPTPEHWYPLHYVLGASDQADDLLFHYEGIENASISMRCLSLSAK